MSEKWNDNDDLELETGEQKMDQSRTRRSCHATLSCEAGRAIGMCSIDTPKVLGELGGRARG
jgi:hypothetical protein